MVDKLGSINELVLVLFEFGIFYVYSFISKPEGDPWFIVLIWSFDIVLNGLNTPFSVNSLFEDPMF